MPVRILWGSPLPPIASGVSDYAVDLLTELVNLVSIRILEPPRWNGSGDLPEAIRNRLVATGTMPDGDEIQVLHLGNNPHHRWLLDRQRTTPTVLVLHDVVLHHLLVESTVAEGDTDAFERAMTGSHGASGGAVAAARRLGFSGHRDPFLFPAVRAMVEGAIHLVVHSQWARHEVARQVPDTAVTAIPLAVARPAVVDREGERERLGLDPAATVIMHLGFLTREKGLPAVLGGLAAAVARGIDAHLVLVGPDQMAHTHRGAIERVGLTHRMHATGWLETERMQTAPGAADLGVVLRAPSAGETSAAAARFFACGTPVAVSGRRQFLELPEAAAPRVTPGPSSAADVARIISDIAGNRGTERESERRQAALDAWHSHYDPVVAAVAMTDVLERVAQRRAR